jgi:hypothetical protein
VKYLTNDFGQNNNLRLTQEEQVAKVAEKKVTEKKKEKKGTKKGTKKEKKMKEVESKEEEKVDVTADSKSKFIAPIHNGPLKPSELTSEMKKYINFAMKGNQNIHMYDANLRALQERRTTRSPSDI